MKINKRLDGTCAGLVSCFALLAILGVAMACPVLENASVNAIEGGGTKDGAMGGETGANTGGSEEDPKVENKESTTPEEEESSDETMKNEGALGQDDEAAAGVPTTHADTVEYNPNLSLTIDGQVCDSEGKNCETYGETAARAGETTYSQAYGVRIDGQDVSDYKLMIDTQSGGQLINTGDTENPSGAHVSSVDSATAGSALTENTWGYAWFDGVENMSVTDENKQSALYNSLSTQQILKQETNLPDGEAIAEKGSLVFAVKFGDEMPSGHYKTDVLLSLTATPKKVVIGLEDGMKMQDVTADVCKETPIYPAAGYSKTLVDQRGGSPISYTVARLQDGNCWMTENLKLPGGTTITTEDSDLNPGSFVVSASSPSTAGTTSYTLPSSSTSGFSSDTAHNMYMSPTAAYGGYYTWCTATAGCRKDNGANPGAGENAGSSICPKGWKLPLGGVANSSSSANGSFGYMLNKAGIADSGGSPTLRGAPYNYQLAGLYYNSSPFNVGSLGYYWSRTANNTSNGYDLYFNTSDIGPADNNARRYGFSVRCVVVVN